VGVLLKTDKVLQVGESIQVLIDWPVALDQRCPLRLLIVGKVLRSNGAGTAVEIMRYEFGIRHQTGAGRSFKDTKERQEGKETKMKSWYMRKNLPATVITVAGIPTSSRAQWVSRALPSNATPRNPKLSNFLALYSSPAAAPFSCARISAILLSIFWRSV